MKRTSLKKWAALSKRDHAAVQSFLMNRGLRLKVISAMQKKGIGVDVDKDDLDTWIDLILKYLPTFLAIILALI